jgi:hypothetical protein
MPLILPAQGNALGNQTPAIQIRPNGPLIQLCDGKQLALWAEHAFFQTPTSPGRCPGLGEPPPLWGHIWLKRNQFVQYAIFKFAIVNLQFTATLAVRASVSSAAFVQLWWQAPGWEFARRLAQQPWAGYSMRRGPRSRCR